MACKEDMLDALRHGEPFFDIGEDYPCTKEVKTLKKLSIIKDKYHPAYKCIN